MPGENNCIISTSYSQVSKIDSLPTFKKMSQACLILTPLQKSKLRYDDHAKENTLLLDCAESFRRHSKVEI